MSSVLEMSVGISILLTLELITLKDSSRSDTSGKGVLNILNPEIP